jgi:hypothetical protein
VKTDRRFFVSKSVFDAKIPFAPNRRNKEKSKYFILQGFC